MISSPDHNDGRPPFLSVCGAAWLRVTWPLAITLFMKFLRDYCPIFTMVVILCGFFLIARLAPPDSHDYYMTFTYQTKDGDESTQQIVLHFKRLDADAILTAQEFVKTNHGRTNISAVILLNAIKLER